MGRNMVTLYRMHNSSKMQPVEYQMAYQSLEDKYTHQAILMKEASKALKASESHVSAMQEELMDS